MPPKTGIASIGIAEWPRGDDPRGWVAVLVARCRRRLVVLLDEADGPGIPSLMAYVLRQAAAEPRNAWALITKQGIVHSVGHRVEEEQ